MSPVYRLFVSARPPEILATASEVSTTIPIHVDDTSDAVADTSYIFTNIANGTGRIGDVSGDVSDTSKLSLTSPAPSLILFVRG